MDRSGFISRSLAALFAAVALAAPATAGAVTLRPGDIIVADSSSQGDGSGAVIRVDPVTGKQTAVSTNAINPGTDLFASPIGIALDAQGRILVADFSSQGDGSGAVIRVNPSTGKQTAVSTNAINTGSDLFEGPFGIAVEPNGSILVADETSQGVGGTGAVIRVDPSTGQQTAISNNAINIGADQFALPSGIALDSQGSILVTDIDSQLDESGSVIRVDPTTGQQTLVSTNAISAGTDLFTEPFGIVLDAKGRILIAERDSTADGTGAVISVDPVTGQQTAVSTNAINPGTDLFNDPIGIALDAQGRILVADQGALSPGAVIRVDPVTGKQTAVSTNAINPGTDLFDDPVGLVVVPPSFARCGGKPATIAGDARRNVIKGTPGLDVIVGLGGNDSIRSLKGSDVVCGGAGRDSLRGGPGRDRLFGGKGRDKLFGGGGRDKLVGGPGRDRQRQ